MQYKKEFAQKIGFWGDGGGVTTLTCLTSNLIKNATTNRVS